MQQDQFVQQIILIQLIPTTHVMFETVRKWAFGSHKRIGPSFLPSCIAYFLVECQMDAQQIKLMLLTEIP